MSADYTTPTVPIALELHGISKTFKRGASVTEVLADVSFSAVEGSITAIVGPSGCGKTTLIDVLAGYEPPTGGTVSIAGSRVDGPAIDQLVVFQENALFPWMTVTENVTFGAVSSRRLSATAARESARALLEALGLPSIGDRFPGQLSGGMQRRVELARALVNEPAVLLLDEPFRGLDALTRRIMRRHFLELHERRPRTTILVTSELEEAIMLAERIVILSARPARVRRTIEVDLPRPRGNHLLTNPAYGAHACLLYVAVTGARERITILCGSRPTPFLAPALAFADVSNA